jgi:hypothetical protein
LHGALILGFALATALSSCTAREAAPKPGTPAGAPTEPVADAKGPDPRAAFESSMLFGGISAVPESPIALIAPAGLPEAGVALSLGGALSTAAIARRIPSSAPGSRFEHELALASGATARLPGPALALASSGERILVACSDEKASGGASLSCFKAEGEGESLVGAWRSEGAAVKRMLAVPGGRVAVADEAAVIRLVDASTGQPAWTRSLAASPADMAYAPGIVLVAAGSSLEAFDESTGASAWRAALTATARSVSAGNGTALVLAESGSLSAFSLADGKGIGAAPGPFDASLRPIADGPRAIVAQAGGGAAEIEVKSGQVLRSWSWSGSSSFLAADRDSIYAGVDRGGGRGVLIASRQGEAGRRVVPLESPAFDAPLAVTGARGGLLLLLMDGSLVLLGKDRERGPEPSALGAAIAPSREAATAIASALERFKPRDSVPAEGYLRFDLFAQGIPVDAGVCFTAFRFDAAASGRRSFFAAPGKTGVVIAVYDRDGREIGVSIDEVGASSTAKAILEKGSVYWIAAGWTFQASPEGFRLYSK